MGQLNWLTSIADLKKSYRGTHRQLQMAREKTEDPAQIGLLSNMISDVNYSIEWMHTGRRPGNRRGIERRAAYQRDKLTDPIRMQAFMSQANAGSAANITQDDRDRIEMALSSLSPQERECYELAHGRGFTFGEIAQMLVIAKSSVQKYVERAQRKVSKELNNNLFLR